jgi:hypothetical protein
VLSWARQALSRLTSFAVAPAWGGYRAANTRATLAINPIITDTHATNITPLRVPRPFLAAEGPAEARPRPVKDGAPPRCHGTRHTRRRDIRKLTPFQTLQGGISYKYEQRADVGRDRRPA